MTSLFEKFRPQTLDEVVGQPGVVKRLRDLEKRGWGGRAYWISGPSASGKTTLARLLVNAVCDPYCIEEMDGHDMTESRIEQCANTMRMRPLGDKLCHGFICNEAHYLAPRVIGSLLTLLESPRMANAIWAFTTTNSGERKLFDTSIDASPLLSRCVVLELTMTAAQLKQYAARLHEIAVKEGMDGRCQEDYVEALKERRGNLRAALQDLESGGLL